VGCGYQPDEYPRRSIRFDYKQINAQELSERDRTKPNQKKRQVRHNTSRRSATCSVPLRSVPLRFAPFRIVLLHYALIIYAPRSVPLRSALLCSSTYAPYYKEPACFHYQHAGFCPIRAVSFHAVMKKNDFFITETTFSVALGPFVLGANICLSSVC